MNWDNMMGYIRRIRNTEKRRYALIYLEYLKSGAARFEEPQHTLSYMGAQSVRIAMRNIWEA